MRQILNLVLVSVILLSIVIILIALSIFFKKRKLAAILQIIFLVLFYLFGSGLIGSFLMSNLNLPKDKLHLKDYSWKKNNAIIVLGGGNVKLPYNNIIAPSLFGFSRIDEAASLYFLCKKSKNHCVIIASGGDPIKASKSEAEVYLEKLVALGADPDDIILESKSLNTYQNAEFSSAIIRANKFDQVFLVTSSWHLKRSLLYFAYFNIKTKPVIADYISLKFSLVPSSYNFAISDILIHEYTGIFRLSIYDFFGLNNK